MIGLLAASQGDKDHIFPASLFDLPGGDQSPGIAQQDDLQKDLRVVGGTSRFIVTISLGKTGSIQTVFH
jgi:hypothetical protein